MEVYCKLGRHQLRINGMLISGDCMKENQLVLVVEDTENDYELLQIAIRKANVSARIQLARDGAEAIKYLRGDGVFANRELYPFPGVLFLDLKMPKLNGFDVLQWLKEHKECKVVPVMVLTSSAMEKDVARAYELGANCYMVKPGDFESLIRLVDLAFRFWGTCVLPQVPERCT
jgi:CheY-like chemotaxis protein